MQWWARLAKTAQWRWRRVWWYHGSKLPQQLTNGFPATKLCVGFADGINKKTKLCGLPTCITYSGHVQMSQHVTYRLHFSIQRSRPGHWYRSFVGFWPVNTADELMNEPVVYMKWPLTGYLMCLVGQSAVANTVQRDSLLAFHSKSVPGEN